MLRKTHIWLGVVLTLPIAIVALTAIFIAHDDSLMLEEILLPFSQTQENDIKAVYALENDQWLVTGKLGIVRFDRDQNTTNELSPFDGRQIIEYQGQLVAAGKQGVYVRQSPGDWQRVVKDDVHQLSVAANGLIAVGKNNHFYQSNDAIEWQAMSAPIELEKLPVQQNFYTAKKLVMDMHTGKAFLGKKAEWIWIDITGLAIFILTFSGVIMWWRRRNNEAG